MKIAHVTVVLAAVNLVSGFLGADRFALAQSGVPGRMLPGFDMIGRGALDSAETFFQDQRQRNEHDPWIATGLGVVYLRRGETATQTFEILLKLFKQDNTSKAIKKFREALEIQPELRDARYYLGRGLNNRRKPDAYSEAAAELSTVVQADSVFPDALHQLGVAHLGLEKWDQALTDFGAALRLLPTDRRPAVRASDALFEKGNVAEGSTMLLENIALVRDEEFLKDVFDPMRPLCTREEREAFEKAPVAERGACVRLFWRKRDPTPGTLENERLLEHYYRLKFARASFAIPVKPFYDDRGKVFLRYGKPQNRYASPLYQGNVKSNESWSYEDLQENLVFDFVEEGGIFREVDDLSRAAGTGTPFESRYRVATDLYAERADLSQMYARLGLLTYSHPSELAARVSEISAAKATAQRRASPEVYVHNYHARPLEFAFSWATFRGDSGKSATEVYLGIPARQLGYRRQVDKSILSHIEATVVVEDSAYNEVSSRTWSRQFVTSDSSEIRRAYPLLLQTLSVPPGSYRLILQVANPEGQGLGIYRMPFVARSYVGNGLMLSDIELAFEVQPAAGEGEFVKHNLLVRPYPMDSMERTRPIYLYYEVYNLSADADNRSRYRVEYETRVLQQDRSFFKSIAGIFGGGKKRGISSSYQQQNTGNVAHEYLALDMGNLPKGTVEISVRVTDESTGQTAQTKRRLILQD